MRAALVMIIALLLAPLAAAQPLPAQLRIAGISTAEHAALEAQLRRIAQERDLAASGLFEIAQRFGATMNAAGGVDLDWLIASVERQAAQMAALQQRLAMFEGVDDPVIADLRTRAAAAVGEGRFADAEALLDEAVAADIAAADRMLAAAQNAANVRRRRAAAARADQAEVANFFLEYSRAAEFYAQAADLLPAGDVAERWRMRLAQALALAHPDACDRAGCIGEGTYFSPANAARANQLLRDTVLPLAPRAQRPVDFAATQMALGENAVTICRFEPARAASPCAVAVGAFAEALGALAPGSQEYARARVSLLAALDDLVRQPHQPARAQMLAPLPQSADAVVRGYAHWAHARLLEAAGERGALEAYQAAADALAPAREDPAASAKWMETQFDLSRALAQGARRNSAQMARAEAAFRAALTLPARTDDFDSWADTAFNLRPVMQALAEQSGADGIERAFAAAERAVPAESRRWGLLQSHWARARELQGEALWTMMEAGAPTVEDAVARYRDASAHYNAAISVWSFENREYSLVLFALMRVNSRSMLAPARARPRRSDTGAPPERGGIPAN